MYPPNKVYENVDILRLPPLGGASSAEAAANQAGINIHYVHPIASADVPYQTTGGQRVSGGGGGELAYYTSTLPHQRNHHPMTIMGQQGGGGNQVPQAPTRQSRQSTSEPRKKSLGGSSTQSNVVTSTLDRYVTCK